VPLGRNAVSPCKLMTRCPRGDTRHTYMGAERRAIRCMIEEPGETYDDSDSAWQVKLCSTDDDEFAVTLRLRDGLAITTRVHPRRNA